MEPRNWIPQMVTESYLWHGAWVQVVHEKKKHCKQSILQLHACTRKWHLFTLGYFRILQTSEVYCNRICKNCIIESFPCYCKSFKHQSFGALPETLPVDFMLLDGLLALLASIHGQRLIKNCL